MKLFTIALTAVFLLAGAGSASAQNIDLGGSASAFYVRYGNGTFVGAGPLVTYHFNDKHAIQLVTDLRYRHTAQAIGVHGIYSVQYRRTLKRAGSPTAFFLTAGGVGGGGIHRVEGFEYIDAGHYEDGKWVPGTAQGVGWEKRTSVSLSVPWVPVVGAGIEHDITPRVAIRADATAALGPYGAMGARASGGFIVRLGKDRNY
jgi:hypothetical protein